MRSREGGSHKTIPIKKILDRLAGEKMKMAMKKQLREMCFIGTNYSSVGCSCSYLVEDGDVYSESHFNR